MSLFSLNASSLPVPALTCSQEWGGASTGVSLPITPPCVARRILPLFPLPGCHVYDAHRNCFQYRPDVQRKLIEAAQRFERRRRHRTGQNAGDSAAATVEADAAALSKADVAVDRMSCRCALDATKLFATLEDMPNPPLPLSRCELHEVLLALPPSWQNYPWRLCFDTATDGFSLSSLYRRMEVVEAKQSQVKTVTFGLFFAHSREDATLLNASLTDSLSASSAKASCIMSPGISGTPHSLREAHCPRRMRQGAAHDTPPHCVLGCFTPEVPCLGRHTANIYFGSPDTFVFRLDQLSCTPSRGAWMATDMKRRQQQEEQRHPQRGSNVADTLDSESLKRSAADPHTSASGTAATALAAAPAYGYARLAVADDGDAGVPVPMPSRMTIEHPLCPTRTADKPTMNSALLLSASEAALLRNSSPPRTDLVSLGHAVGISRAFDAPGAVLSSPVSRRRWPLRPARPAQVVPLAPLLEKFTWCGHANNKRFVVCNSHFFAIGGGKNGAALYVDETLQYGTSSLWCETFNAPCLFDPRVGGAKASPASSSILSFSSGDSGPRDDHVTARGGSARLTSGLPHMEFTISRVVWFSLTEDKRNRRTMRAIDALLTCEEAQRCGCGRCGGDGDNDATSFDLLSTAATMAAVPPSASTFLHRCDLLPCAVPV
uniref:Oxidation resistance protein 1 n=1 Tax=Leishmania guyanensis TaxID=5670 RepID=A0A1E1IPB7_LEIGU|nr:hypothetical protein, conserved [Leishmania guyanensis]